MQQLPDAPPDPTLGYAVVAITASAGGLAALQRVLSSLPVDFPAAIVVVLHMSPNQPGSLAAILGRSTTLPVQQARDGDRLISGRVYAASPDYHLLVHAEGTVSLSHEPRVHYSRPSADVRFASIAHAFGPRAVAVVLTGSGSDGAAGARAVKDQGGAVIAQDEASSEHFSMPRAAIDTGSVDQILPPAQIGPALVTLVANGGAA
ncbi:MAG: chemotaxis protein CheB [Chloroflexi bacterium]|nr:chemotaxis protein CheB [Chloroflexota bacterium]